MHRTTLATGLTILIAATAIAGGWLAWQSRSEPFLIPPDAVLPDGGRYYGEVRDAQFHGRGRIVWPNGTRYEGEFRNGQFSGQGRYVDPHSASYEGRFENGQFHGRGKLHYANGDVYEGEFADGRPHGRGKFTLAETGDVYEGDVVQGKFTGAGVHVDRSGNRYEGGFSNWKYHSQGRYTTSEGAVYEGQFVDGRLTGAGKYQDKDGEQYEGEFRNWRYHGRGRLVESDGDIYQGDFEDGLYHGEGTLTYAQPYRGASSVSGKWRYGRKISEPEESARIQTQIETALYNQERLLNAALKDLLPGDPDRIDLYLLAVAGDGKQDVFLREAEFVQRLFDEEYGARMRSLLIANNPATVDRTPLATATSVATALAGLARKMNPDDILFVFMTSHGSSEHELVLDLNGLELPDLPARKLGELFQQLPIRWKVVVISACFSGGFIPHLENDYTLVMTAADHDRKSFGCTDDADMTYFGRALFKEALPRSRSFDEAFERARELVREWEDKEKDSRSEPQISRPRPILEHLARWQAQRATFRQALR
jgi:hypothetical protein